jgi:hypothetical protein
MVKVIWSQNALAEFPGRTAADLVAYILRYRGELYLQWLENPPTPAPSLADVQPAEEGPEADAARLRSEQAAQLFVEKTRQDGWGRLVAWIKRHILRWEVLDEQRRGDPS